MPVLKELSKKYGFKIIIPVVDHEPKHVHVFKGDSNYAKIEIKSLKVVKSRLSRSELNKAIKIVKENQDHLIDRWNIIVEVK